MKTLTLLLILSWLILGVIATEDQQDITEKQMPGGFFQMDDVDLSKPLVNTQDHPLADIEAYIRKELRRDIGKVTDLELQVVEGLNYRFTFTNSKGEQLQTTILEQPWKKERRMIQLTPLLLSEL